MGERTHRRVSEGAGSTAPTAPHATPARTREDARTGPARFWSAERIRQGLAGGFVVSLVFHYVIAPFSVMPAGPAIKFHEQAGDLSIPVEFIGIEGDDPAHQKDPQQNGNGSARRGLTDAAMKNARATRARAREAGADARKKRTAASTTVGV